MQKCGCRNAQMLKHNKPVLHCCIDEILHFCISAFLNFCISLEYILAHNYLIAYYNCFCFCSHLGSSLRLSFAFGSRLVVKPERPHGSIATGGACIALLSGLYRPQFLGMEARCVLSWELRRAGYNDGDGLLRASPFSLKPFARQT